MADWSSQNITLTAKGASALSKVQAGSGSLTITKVVASEQYVAESTLREVTSLSVENLPLTIIDRHEVQDGGSVIQVQLSNLYLGKAFTLNEIGVFATHSDNPSEEFLYIIAQVDAETGDKIPLYATTPVTATYDIYLYNVGADNIEITISSAGLVTYEALNKACDIIQRNTAYEVGDILHSHSLKKGLAIKCTVAGITKSTDTDLSHKNVGDTVEDGTSQWVVIAPSTTADFDAHNHSVDAHPELMRRFIESGVNVIKRSHSYAKGDIAYSDKIPSWAFLECTVAGTTSDGWYFPEPSEIKVDDTIVDYTVTWKVRKVADTASKLATARNIALTGNASGSANFDGSGNVSINATVNESKHAAAADTATKVNAKAPNGGTADLVFGIMANSDYARVCVGGSADNGWLEIATSDNGDEPIYARQYSGSFLQDDAKSIANEAVLLDDSGNTKFPKNVTAANFTGPLNGNAATATTASMLQTTDCNGAIDNGKFYWVGKDGQPTWLWGSDTRPSETYVYNPSNFHVSAADNDGNGANIAATYLKRSGGQITGDLTFSDIGNVGTSNKISWNGSTDGADIYYQTTESDQGNLVLNFRDDVNCYLRIAYNGAFKSYFSPSDGNFHGNADTATNADKLDGYHASDLFRHLGGNQTPVITDIFDRAGTIDMGTMSAADKATHKADINKSSNMTQDIWNTYTGIHAYGGDYDIAGYNRGTLKLTQSYKNFDKILVVGVDDKGYHLTYKLWDVWALANAFAGGSHFHLFHGRDYYWFLYGSTRKGTNTDYALSTDTVWSCQDQNSGIVAIYGIKY